MARRSTTSDDVAEEAGVSQATVSRVLNGDPRVASDTRARVLEVIKRLDYTPDTIARSLVTRRTGLVGVVVSDVMNPFYPEFIEAIGDQLDEYGLKMVFYNAGGQPEDAYARMLLEQRVDGIIITSALRDSVMVRDLVAQGLPLVLTNRYADDVNCDVAVGDNEAGARSVAEHLVSLGHERIGVIEGNRRASTTEDRLKGFRAALESAGVQLDEALVCTADFRYGDAFECAKKLLRLSDPPTAIFCLNDHMAFGAVNAATDMGLDVPGDLSVVGFDDIWMATWERFQLTTVHQPLAEMAKSSVDLLVERLENPDRSVRKLVFPSKLVVRRTTGERKARAGKASAGAAKR